MDLHKVDVEKRIAHAINADLKDFLGVVRDDAEALRQRHAFLAPANGSGQPPITPWVDQPFCLVDRNHTNNLIGRLDNGLVEPQLTAVGKTGATKKKLVDSGDTPARARPRNQVAGAASSSSAFIQSMSEWNALAAGEVRRARRYRASTTTKTTPERAAYTPGSAVMADLGADGSTYTSGD